MLDGKLTDRVTLRITEGMGSRIRLLADIEHRSIEAQIRVLIALGLSIVMGQSGKANSEGDCQQMSETRIPLAAPGPKAAQIVRSGQKRETA